MSNASIWLKEGWKQNTEEFVANKSIDSFLFWAQILFSSFLQYWEQDQ